MTEVWPALAALGAGVASSTGPCVAPRFLAAATLCTGATGMHRWVRLGAFVAGLTVSYVVACSAGGAIARVRDHSVEIYVLVGVACAAAGVVAVVSAHSCKVEGEKRPSGIAFFWGGATAVVGSPCCGPLTTLAVAGWSAGAFDPLLPAMFALGHAVPLAAIALGSTRIESLVRPRWPKEATSTVSGGLALALGAYFVVLA